MKLISMCAIPLLLAGCCTPKIVYVPVEVKIPVTVKCKVSYPPKPVDIGTLPIPKDPYDRVMMVVKENEGLRSYSASLDAIVRTCSEEVK